MVSGRRIGGRENIDGVQPRVFSRRHRLQHPWDYDGRDHSVPASLDNVTLRDHCLVWFHQRYYQLQVCSQFGGVRSDPRSPADCPLSTGAWCSRASRSGELLPE
ncbi:hypothetical protein BDV98DRAFT_420756 [Pterulicium gracile]|uniref:Uncharacterized protein n=1 Tax=Pterulicium gracile TaxID=1884261 RepID=A0A5C3Q150_9AGAR|nr:hypothetical protein BDV98DRAFT_420756 [Pterula gracilis]